MPHFRHLELLHVPLFGRLNEDLGLWRRGRQPNSHLLSSTVFHHPYVLWVYYFHSCLLSSTVFSRNVWAECGQSRPHRQIRDGWQHGQGTHCGVLRNDQGTWQDYVKVRADELILLPALVPFDQLAISILNPLTAWRLLNDFEYLKEVEEENKARILMFMNK